LKKNKFNIFTIFLLSVITYSCASNAQQFTQEQLEDFNNVNNSITAEETTQHNNSINQRALDQHTNSAELRAIKNTVEATKSEEGCDIDDDEQLVCEALMCVIGIAIPESAAECLDVNIRFAAYIATLGPLRSPPSCKSRNDQCESTGKASKAPVEVAQCQQLGLGDDPCEWLDQ